jgi:hypothetical protein
MERVRNLADLSIRRGCGFGLIAIGTAMTGMAGDIAMAIKGGAIMTTLMGAVLVIKALRASATNYRRTEVWIMLGKKIDGWPPHRLQQLIGGILRDRYLWHAEKTAVAALTLWMATFVLAVFR